MLRGARRLLILLCSAIAVLPLGAQLSSTTNHVNIVDAASGAAFVQTWLDPLAYAKPGGIDLRTASAWNTANNVPLWSTSLNGDDANAEYHYYIDLSSGSDSSSCGTSTSNACRSLRGIICGTCGSPRNLLGLRGNSADGVAVVYIKGTGTSRWYSFCGAIDNGIRGSSSTKKALFRPWPGQTLVTMNRGDENVGLTGECSNNYIVDGMDYATHSMVFKFVSDVATGKCSGGPCYNFAVDGDGIVIAHSQFTCGSASGSGWMDLLGLNNSDGNAATDYAIIGNEFYSCETNGQQSSAMYMGPCADGGGCSLSNVVVLGNIMRNLGGEAVEANPRVASSNYLFAYNAIHHVGFMTCNHGTYDRGCRPAFTLATNNSGALTGVVIRNNIMWDLSSGCIWDKSNATGTAAPRIYNNSCYDYGKGSGAIPNDQPQGISSHLSNNGSHAFVQNDLIYAPNGTDPYGADGISFQASSNNLCGSAESCGTSKQSWSAASVLSTDPANASFMTINASSEAAGHGADTSAYVIDDYVSATRTLPYDIGAF